jgi:hypothetical protein
VIGWLSNPEWHAEVDRAPGPATAGVAGVVPPAGMTKRVDGGACGADPLVRGADLFASDATADREAAALAALFAEQAAESSNVTPLRRAT